MDAGRSTTGRGKERKGTMKHPLQMLVELLMSPPPRRRR
jgi:hypothetical protein